MVLKAHVNHLAESRSRLAEKAQTNELEECSRLLGCLCCGEWPLHRVRQERMEEAD